MSTRTIRALASIVIVVGAVSLLLFTTMRGSADYYKHVDEVMPDASSWYGKNLQLHGFVVDDTVKNRPGTLDYLFDIKYNNAVVQASYTGVMPDTFKDGAEVVLTGHLTPAGFQVASNGVTAKCPSRYDPSKPQEGK